jgi:hypothetical protein
MAKAKKRLRLIIEMHDCDDWDSVCGDWPGCQGLTIREEHEGGGYNLCAEGVQTVAQLLGLPRIPRRKRGVTYELVRPAVVREVK